MAAGNQPSLQGINAQAGQIVINARNALQQILFFNDYLQVLGQNGLVALQMSSTDAALLLSVYADLAAYANSAMGQPYTGPALPHDFLATTVPLWGGM